MIVEDFNNRIMDIEECEDNKGGIRICISKKNRQHNDQKITKGESESVYQRRTDNTMIKRKRNRWPWEQICQ